MSGILRHYNFVILYMNIVHSGCFFIFPTFLVPFAFATSWDIGAGFEGICIVFVGNSRVAGLYAGPNYCQSHMFWWAHGCLQTLKCV